MQPVDAAVPSPSAAMTTGAEAAGAIGLTAAEAADRLLRDGPNVIGGSGQRPRLAILVSQVSSPLVLMLVAASLVSLVVGDEINASIILAIVVLSAALGFVQEARSEAAVAALQARSTLQASVVRDGVRREIPIHDVVRGDQVLIKSGRARRRLGDTATRTRGANRLGHTLDVVETICALVSVNGDPRHDSPVQLWLDEPNAAAVLGTPPYPDGAVAIESDGRSGVICLEIDEATQRRAVIEAKLNGYRRLFDAYPTWTLLFVVPSRTRAGWLRSAAGQADERAAARA